MPACTLGLKAPSAENPQPNDHACRGVCMVIPFSFSPWTDGLYVSFAYRFAHSVMQFCWMWVRLELAPWDLFA